ncbi:MAG: hypothetical protein WD750_05880 [Gammaproteobacteria bacterium]
MNPVHEQILAIIDREPRGLNAREVFERASLCTDAEQCSKALYHLMDQGEIVRHGNQYYPAGTPAPATDSSDRKEGNAMSIEIKGKKQRQIYDTLKRPMTANQIAGVTFMTVAQIQAQISVLKKKGLVASETRDGRTFYLRRDTDGTVAPTATTTAKKAAKKKPGRMPAAQPNGDDPVERLLALNVEAAQSAMDEYITSVCDPDTLALFREQRDHARSCLDQYREKRS